MASDLEVCHTDSSLALDCHLESDQPDQLQLLQYSLSVPGATDDAAGLGSTISTSVAKEILGFTSGGTKLEKLNGVAAAAAAAGLGSTTGGTKLEKLNGVAAAAAAAQDPCPKLEELSWTGVGFIVRLFFSAGL
jgi:hypothetical protein